MKDGILVLYKPQNWTSSDCVAVCRRALGIKGVHGGRKVGHGGTLDPMATGVLPVFVGQATRIMEYMELDTKTYVCCAKLGMTTDTLDIWGQILSETPWEEARKLFDIDRSTLLDAVASFEGEIEHYDYAYKGKEVDFEIKPRKAFVDRICVIDTDLETGQFAFEIECSKGTYVRTICSDIGEKLGCGCVMTALERTAVGNISIEQVSVSAEDVKNMELGQLDGMLLPADYPLVHFGKAVMPAERADYFRMGNRGCFCLPITRWCTSGRR